MKYALSTRRPSAASATSGATVASAATLAVAASLAALLAACSGSPGPGLGDGAPQGDGGMMPPGDGSMHMGDSGPQKDGQPPSDSSGGSDTASDTMMPPADTGTDTAPPSDPDGFGASRKACVDEINKLRATQSLPAYTLVDTPSVDMCIDEQTTNDEKRNSPHYSWINGVYPTCNGNAQDECEGYGTDPAGITKCLDDMWNEQTYPNCKGCVGCSVPGGGCPGCDFYGMMGPECGHYVNMSASYFSQVWCGFSTSPGGSWAAQNFQ